MIFLVQCDPLHGCGNEYPSDVETCPSCGASQQFSQPALINHRDYVYDIETYPNIFTCCFIHLATGTTWRFEISDRINQINEFIEFLTGLKNCRARLVGYNNEGFDYPVIHYIIHNQWVTVTEIYNKAMAVIKSRDIFEHTVWDRDRYVPQIDLYKIHHFDNAAKATSLKALEIAMRMKNVSDLPFPVGTMLNDAEKEVLHNYNYDDCVATAFFYVRTIPMIKLRDKLSEKFSVNFMNRNDVKMGEMILIGEMEKRGIETTEFVSGRKIKKKTERASIDLGSVVFPYIKFERPEFEMIRSYLMQQVITETKGVFNDIECTPEMLRFMDHNKIKVYGYKGPIYRQSKGVRVTAEHKNNKPVKLSNIPPNSNTAGCRFESENLHCVINGFRYDFGTGGLHASVSSQILRSDDEYQVVDVDVASFYPNLGIKNRLYPEHLSADFCDAYLDVYHTRKSYDKKSAENGAFKLALNGAFGGSNNEHSPFYDPKYTMLITVNGQLLLCMLVEQMLKIPNLKMIQCNTDGITYRLPKQYVEHQRAVCRWWESLTCLELEEALYKAMFIDHVNSYMAEYESGEIKRIGAYAHVTPDEAVGTRERSWSKDHSALVVPKIAQRVLVEGLDARTLIEEYNDPYDFLIRAKVPRSDSLVMRYPEYGVDIPSQNTTRYFVSKTGGELMKISPPSGVAGSWKRAPGVKDSLYNTVMAELQALVSNLDAMGGVPNANSITYEGVTYRLDTLGLPHDPRIHTKSKTTHETREGGMCAGWKVTDCADVSNFDRSQVNVDYYIAEVDKITKPLMG